MGLDMYVKSTRVPPPAPVDFEEQESDQEVFYWRKHPNLHGWMEQLYLQKGGSKEFNVTPVQLEEADIERLARELKALPHTEGFFFGRSQPEDDDQTEAFIALARGLLKEGNYLYYTSWW